MILRTRTILQVLALTTLLALVGCTAAPTTPATGDASSEETENVENTTVSEEEDTADEEEREEGEEETETEIDPLMQALIDGTRHIKGDPDAPITIIDFSDFQCSHCARFAIETEPKIEEELVETGKVRFGFRHFAFLSEESVRAAEASECAAEQDAFWEYHDLLFGSNISFTDENLKEFASDLDLDIEQFEECLDSGKYQKTVKGDLTTGRSMGVQGTPHFIVSNGERLGGAQTLSAFKQAIGEEPSSSEQQSTETNEEGGNAGESEGMVVVEQPGEDISTPTPVEGWDAEDYVESGKEHLDAYNAQQAIADFNVAIERDPDNVEAYNYRGFAYMSLNDTEQAIEDLTKAIELDDEYAEAYTNRSFAYYLTDELDLALEDAEQAVELDPDSLQAHSNRGLVHYHKENFDLAVQDLNFILERTPENVDALYSRGMVYLDAGNTRKAINDFEEVVEMADDNTYLRQQAEKQLEELGASD